MPAVHIPGGQLPAEDGAAGGHSGWQLQKRRRSDLLMEYTWASVVGVVVVVLVELLWLKTGIFMKATYWIAYGIIVFFQVIVDGWLTKLSAPIVEYNPEKLTGWRAPWDVPVEDYLFGFALVTLPIMLWERAGRRRAAAAGGGSAPGGTAPTPPR